jgi:hypothetical protein
VSRLAPIFSRNLVKTEAIESILLQAKPAMRDLTGNRRALILALSATAAYSDGTNCDGTRIIDR